MDRLHPIRSSSSSSARHLRRLTAATLLAGIVGVAGTTAVAQERTAPPDRSGAVAPAEAKPVRNTKAWNLPKRSTLAIKGYDPVAYFEEGGGKATKGLSTIALEHGGVTYRFATEANRDRFERDPGKYEPAYGGWCAWAMASGEAAPIDPKKFIVKDGRLFLFFNGVFNDTRSKWRKKDHAKQVTSADTEWKKRSGESPRQPTPAADDERDAGAAARDASRDARSDRDRDRTSRRRDA